MDTVPFSSAAALAKQNEELLDNLKFKDLNDAFEWIKANRAMIQSKKGEGELSLRYIALVLEVAGRLEGIDVHRLQRRCGAYDNYLENRELVDKLCFADMDEAFEWIKTNRAMLQSKKGEKELSLSYIVLILEVGGRLEGIDAQNLQRRCTAYDNYLENKEVVDKLYFADVDDAFEWIKVNRAIVRPKKGEKELSLGYIVDILEVAGRLEGIGAQYLHRRCGAYDNYLENKQVIDKLYFADVDDAFEWVKVNRAIVRPKKGEKELSLGYIVDILEVAGNLEGIDIQSLGRRCGAYDNYLENKQVIDQLSFADVDDAFEWIKANRAMLQSKKGEGELSLSYISLVLEVAGRLEGIGAQHLQRRCGAYDNYLENKEVVDKLCFADVNEAFEWVKANRAMLQSKKGEVELSLSYIVDVLEIAERLVDIDAHYIQRRCGAYDNYLENKQVIDQLSFADGDDAFEWIKANREIVRPKKGEKELSLGYIVDILQVAGKLEGIDAHRLHRRCTAYDNYLENMEVVDKLCFADADAAFEWVKENRAMLQSKKGEAELSLGYIVEVLQVGGRLEDIDVQNLKRRCAAYDFFKAKEHFFVSRIASFISENQGMGLSDFITWCLAARAFDTATLFHSVKGEKTISKTYLKLVLKSARSELQEHFERVKEKNGSEVEQQGIDSIKACYGKAVKAIAKKEKAKKISSIKAFGLIRRKRREIKLALSALQKGAKLEKKAFRKIVSAA